MIKQFQGEYRWLSNFVTAPVFYQGDYYFSVEHAYQAAKNSDPNWRKFCKETISPGIVKQESKYIQPNCCWEPMFKISVMRELIQQKFSQEPFRSLLLSTGDVEIQEGNWWRDKFWGVCLRTGIGKNNLGKVIMDFRHYLVYENLD